MVPSKLTYWSLQSIQHSEHWFHSNLSASISGTAILVAFKLVAFINGLDTLTSSLHLEIVMFDFVMRKNYDSEQKHSSKYLLGKNALPPRI